MILTFLICFFSGFPLPIILVQSQLLRMTNACYRLDALCRLTESDPLAVDPLGTIANDLNALRAKEARSSLGFILMLLMVSGSLAWWGWAREARFSFIFSILGALFGCPAAEGYRREMSGYVDDFLREWKESRQLGRSLK